MRTILFLSALLIGGAGYVQQMQDATNKDRRPYMTATYHIHSVKTRNYEQLRKRMLKANDRLKDKVMSAERFRAEQKRLYRLYGDTISQLFDKGRSRTWSRITQELERYQMLSEVKLTPRDKMLALHKLESEWEKNREAMWKGSDTEARKQAKEADMIAELNGEIRKLLGTDVGNWYIEYKTLGFMALLNMDKYKTSYKNGHAIAEIELKYRKKRADILKTKKKYAEKEVESMKNDEKKEQEIFASVPADVANRWKKVNAAVLDYTLQNRYGLNQLQTTKFKAEYNKYAIEEYKILNAKKLSPADRYARLDKLGDSFCRKVKPLFSAENYVKWQGWWQYDFERRMKRKGLK